MHNHRTWLIQTHQPPASYRWTACAAMVLLFALPLSVACADDTSLKDDAKRAGHVIGTAARDIGQGAKKMGKAVGEAAKEGALELRRAFKGESR